MKGLITYNLCSIISIRIMKLHWIIWSIISYSFFIKNLYFKPLSKWELFLIAIKILYTWKIHLLKQLSQVLIPLLTKTCKNHNSLPSEIKTYPLILNLIRSLKLPIKFYQPMVFLVIKKSILSISILLHFHSFLG